MLRLDVEAVERVVQRRISADGVIEAWERLCVPALVEVGRRGGAGLHIDAEHLFSVTLSAALYRVAGSAGSWPGRGVLIGCPSGERHTLAMEALRAALVERSCPVRLLGADLPTAAWVEAVRRTRPRVVAVWAQTERTARTGVLSHLHANSTVTVLALGPGRTHRRLPAGVLTTDTLHDAVQMILALQRM